MRKLRISTRLLLGFGVTILLMLVIAATGIWRMADTYRTNHLLQQRQQVTEVVNELAGKVEVNASQVLALSRLTAHRDVEFFEAQLAASQQQVDTLYKQLEAVLPEGEATAIFESAQKIHGDYLAGRELAIQDVELGHAVAADEFFSDKMPALLNNYIAELRRLAAFQESEVQALIADSEAGIQLGQTMIIALGLVAVLIGLATAWLITRSIAGPLNRAVDLAGSVAQRDLTQTIVPQGNDEISRLEQALQEMVQGLQAAMGQVHTGSAAIAQAAAEISMGNLDLSARTEQQASSLAETASAMEEMTTTVRQNDDHARQANTLSDSSAQVARAGSAAVHSLTETMGDINQKSQQIAEIVDVIDGIAFQTNILALNAAVEAARAGEQGRGFAVVASEVRALAQRSAGAAREIKELIDSSVAVIAQGNEQAAQADSGMEKVLESIQHVADLLDEISTASNEQTVGIEQINQSVAQMDDVTRQNAGLVEEAVAAAENMDAQARRLAELVGTFQLNGQQSIAHLGAVPAHSGETDITPRPFRTDSGHQNGLAHNGTQQLPQEAATNREQARDGLAMASTQQSSTVLGKGRTKPASVTPQARHEDHDDWDEF